MQENVKRAMSVINRSANRLRAQIAKVSDQIVILERERAQLMALPVSRNDFAKAVCAAIDFMADGEREKFERYFLTQVKAEQPHTWGIPTAHNTLLLAEGRVKMTGLFSRLVNHPDPVTFPSSTAIFMLRDAIKKAITESVEAVDWPYKNPKSLDEINARVAEIDQEIEQLAAERKELMATARDIGIDVSDARLSAAQQLAETPAQD